MNTAEHSCQQKYSFLPGTHPTNLAMGFAAPVTAPPAPPPRIHRDAEGYAAAAIMAALQKIDALAVPQPNSG